MTLPEYITATRSTDLVNTTRHAALGLISEIGEVYGVLARIERGDPLDRAARMCAELGDAAWYLARLTDLDPATGRAPDLTPPRTLQGSFDEFAKELIEIGFGYLQLPIGSGQNRWHRLAWTRWSRLCSIEGLDPTAVLAVNLAKLRDRAERRVLRGDGDNR